MTLIFTFGLDMVLINVMLALFSADIRGIPLAYSSAALTIGEIRLPYTRLNTRSHTPCPSRSPRCSNFVSGRYSGLGA